MSFSYSIASLNKIKQCDYRLQCLAFLMLDTSLFDLTVLEGYRGEEAQEIAYKSGKSKAHFGQSKHNFTPSCAIDIAPYPINWSTTDSRWQELGKLAKCCAKKIGIDIVWGGDFKTLKDYPHIELKG